MVEIKICGIRDEATAAVAIDAGVTYVGVVTGTRESPRYVEGNAAISLIQYLHGKVSSVLVTRELTRDFIILAKIANPDLVQFHGPMPSPLLGELRQAYAGRIIFGISPRLGTEALASLARVVSKHDLLLIDGSQGKGTGIDEHLLITFTDQVKQFIGLSLKDMLVAGGLTPFTVGTFLERHAPRGVDASSGLEASPGAKDPELVRAFCQEVKKARIVHD